MAAVFRIETGIAPPRSERQELLAAIRSLGVGESVLVSGKTIRYASDCAQVAKLGTEKYFECRTVTAGTRVWRRE